MGLGERSPSADGEDDALTTTRSPEPSVVAVCTCAIDAAASAARSKL